MKIEIGKKYKIRSYEWIKENYSELINESIYNHVYTKFHSTGKERLIKIYLKNRLFKVERIVDNFAVNDRTKLVIPVELLYDSVTEILTKIKNKIEG